MKYHFSIVINFKKDIDIKNLSKKFKLEPYKLIELKDSKALPGFDKVAKMWYRTNDFEAANVNIQFDKFVEKVKVYFEGLQNILNENDGNCHFEIIFTELEHYPIIAMSNNSAKILGELGADFSVDFLV